MMGDGAAAARPNRQPRTQSARRGPASAPRAPRASVIALPGPARRPGVAGSLRVAASPPGWRLLPQRRAALRAIFASVASALPGSAAHGPAPQPAPPPPALAAPGKAFVCLKPQMRSLQPPREEVWMQRKQGGQPPDVAGRAGRALAVRRGGRAGGVGGAQARPAPPLSPSRPPPLFSFSFSAFFFFSPRPAALSLCEHHQCINARPPNLCPPIPAQNLRTPCGETSGATTLDVRRLESSGTGRDAPGQDGLHSQGRGSEVGRKGQK